MLAIDTSLVILRLVHIVTGVTWVGSLFVVVVFVQPIAAALGPAGRRSCRSFSGADSWMSSSSTPCSPSPPGRSYTARLAHVSELRRLDRLELRNRVDGGRSPRGLGDHRRRARHASYHRSARSPRNTGR